MLKMFSFFPDVVVVVVVVVVVTINDYLWQEVDVPTGAAPVFAAAAESEESGSASSRALPEPLNWGQSGPVKQKNDPKHGKMDPKVSSPFLRFTFCIFQFRRKDMTLGFGPDDPGLNVLERARLAAEAGLTPSGRSLCENQNIGDTKPLTIIEI